MEHYLDSFNYFMGGGKKNIPDHFFIHDYNPPKNTKNLIEFVGAKIIDYAQIQRIQKYRFNWVVDMTFSDGIGITQHFYSDLIAN